MTQRGMGREDVHRTAWAQESYPHPMASCLMPVSALLAILAVMLFGFQMWQWSLPRDTTVPHVVALPRQEAERVGWWWKTRVNARRLITWPPILSIIP